MKKVIKTRKVLKPWAEYLLAMIIVINVVAIVSINDFSTITGMLVVYGVLGASTVICANILGKYGRYFRVED